MLVLRVCTDALMHGRVGGDGGEGLDRDLRRELLEEFEGGDGVIGLGLGVAHGRAARAAGVGDDEHGGGAAGELDEVERVEEDGRPLGGIGRLYHTQHRRQLARPVHASQHPELALPPQQLHVSLLVRSLPPIAIVIAGATTLVIATASTTIIANDRAFHT